MELQSGTTQFLEELQSHFGRKLAFPIEVGFLAEQAGRQGLHLVFRDAIFQAKFVTKTMEVMNRIGREGEGFDKLSSEFQNSIEKSSALLKTIVKESPEDFKQHIVREFFGMDQESLGNFLRLLEDLSWVKNFELDGHSLPLAGESADKSSRTVRGSTLEQPKRPNPSAEFTRIRNGAALAILLMLLLFIIDAPVTFIGWTLSIIVVLMLFYIVLASQRLHRNSDVSV